MPSLCDNDALTATFISAEQQNNQLLEVTSVRNEQSIMHKTLQKYCRIPSDKSYYKHCKSKL